VTKVVSIPTNRSSGLAFKNCKSDWTSQ